MSPRNCLGVFGWILDFLTFFFKVKIHHENLKEFLEINGHATSCYVLRVNSLWDFIVLHKICRAYKLPLPHFKLSLQLRPEYASCIGLQKRGLFQSVKSRRKSLPRDLEQSISLISHDPNLNLNIIPVSVFWGRNPGSEDNSSLLKLLFFDDERAGSLQKLLIVMFQCRQIQVSFGKSTQMRDVIASEKNPEVVVRKLRRLLRVHFHKVRVSVLGPELYNRSQVANWILRSDNVKELLERESKGDPSRYLKLETEAARYVYEISAEVFYPVIRFFEIILGWLFKRIYDKFHVHNFEQLRQSTVGHEVIYLPCHRSHIDYLVSSLVIHKFGINRPHTGAGSNLNFWPVGIILRRAGAFFLRRSFGGNKLYATIFSEYMHYLLTKGHPIQFFIEGGRSRSGFFLKPKLGMLSMVLQSYVREQAKPVQLVPVCVGYDRIFEIDSYYKEMQGAKKKNESFGQLFRAKKILSTPMGGCYVNFGNPLLLDEILDRTQADWRELGKELSGDRPDWLNDAVHQIGDQVMKEISKLSVVSPVALTSMILLAMPQRAIAESDAKNAIEVLLNLARTSPWGSSINLPFSDPNEILQWSVRYSDIQVHESLAGNVVFLNAERAHKYAYYRNNMMGVFGLYALIALYAVLHDDFNEDDLLRETKVLLPFVGQFFTIPGEQENIQLILKHHIENLLHSGLLTRVDTHRFKAAEYFSREHEILRILANTVRPFCERIAIVALCLANQEITRVGQMSFGDLIKNAQAISDRSALLSGTSTLSPSDHSIVQDFVQYLRRNQLIANGPNESVIAAESFKVFSASLEKFVDKNIAMNLRRQLISQGT